LQLEKIGVGLGESLGVGHSVLEAEGIENVKSENTCFNSMGVGILNLYLF
jgi:hypothetical protein